MRTINKGIGLVCLGLVILLSVAITANTLTQGLRSSSEPRSGPLWYFDQTFYFGFILAIPSSLFLVANGWFAKKELIAPVSAVISTAASLWLLLSADPGFYLHVLSYKDTAMRLYAAYTPTVIMGFSWASITSFRHHSSP